MGRRARDQSEPSCYHVTHRCHGRSYLLKFKRDRRAYLERLRQARNRYRIDVLSYQVTSNHVHLVLWAQRAADVSSAMHFVQGSFAGDYNRRKSREGAFWRGRYHPTLIETGVHLSRCLFYVELNMVRAGACDHPATWLGSAFDEICGRRQRYLIIDRERLLWCLGMDDEVQFRRWYEATVEEMVRQEYRAREPWWSEALAVGGEQWVRRHLPRARNVRVEAVPSSGDLAVGEPPGTYAVRAAQREQQAFWRGMTR